MKNVRSRKQSKLQSCMRSKETSLGPCLLLTDSQNTIVILQTHNDLPRQQTDHCEPPGVYMRILSVDLPLTFLLVFISLSLSSVTTGGRYR